MASWADDREVGERRLDRPGQGVKRFRVVTLENVADKLAESSGGIGLG